MYKQLDVKTPPPLKELVVIVSNCCEFQFCERVLLSSISFDNVLQRSGMFATLYRVAIA